MVSVISSDWFTKGTWKWLCLFFVVIFQTSVFGQRAHVSSEKMRFHIYYAEFLDSPDGQIIPDITTGFRPFTYEWVGPDGFTSQDSILQNAMAGKYFLRMEDSLCGTFSDEFEIGATKNEYKEFSEIKIGKVTPNPFIDRISVVVNSNVNKTSHVKIINANSHLVYYEEKELFTGKQIIIIENLILSAGMYIIQICVDDKCMLSETIIKVF